MNPDAAFVFGILGVAGALFASGRVRLDVTALLVVVALMLSGVLTPREALAGFGDPVVLLVAALLVVGEMLTRTGVSYAMGQWLMRLGGTSETRLLVLLMLSAALLGSVMSSTAVVAPGSYSFLDFVKVGLPLLVLTWLTTLLVTPIFFPF